MPNAVEQAERNYEIVTAKMRGLSWSQIATSFELTERRCQQIFAEWRKTNPTLREHDAIDIADELLEGYKADIEELVMVAATTKNDTAKIGAINSRMNARQRITELLQALGTLPNDLGELRVEIDARVTAQRIVAVLTEAGVEQTVKDKLIEVLEGTATDKTPQLEPA